MNSAKATVPFNGTKEQEAQLLAVKKLCRIVHTLFYRNKHRIFGCSIEIAHQHTAL